MKKCVFTEVQNKVANLLGIYPSMVRCTNYILASMNPKLAVVYTQVRVINHGSTSFGHTNSS